MAPVLDTRTVSAIQNRNSGSGASTWLEAVVRVCSDLHFRFSPRGSFCKSSFEPNVRFSLDGLPTEVTSPSAALSGALEDPKASSSFTSLQTADSVAPGNESSECRAKHQKSVHSGIHFASCSMDPLLARSVSAQEPAAVLRCWRQHWEVDAQERSRRARSLLTQAALPVPSVTECDIILEALAEFPDPSETTPRWPGLADTSFRKRSGWCGAPKHNCRRHRDGYQAQC